MKFLENDEFNKLTYDIMHNEEFLKLNEYVHHGITRMEHSLRVAYYSYITAKVLKLDYKEVAEGAILHDFFHEDYDEVPMRVYSMFTHAKKSLSNASQLFELSDMKKDIIETHMFPISFYKPPKYLESWLVSIVDKMCSIYEFSLQSRKVLTRKHACEAVLTISLISQLI